MSMLKSSKLNGSRFSGIFNQETSIRSPMVVQSGNDSKIDLSTPQPVILGAQDNKVSMDSNDVNVPDEIQSSCNSEGPPSSFPSCPAPSSEAELLNDINLSDWSDDTLTGADAAAKLNSSCDTPSKNGLDTPSKAGTPSSIRQLSITPSQASTGSLQSGQCDTDLFIDDKWTCLRCAMTNSELDDVCSICKTGRFDESLNMSVAAWVCSNCVHVNRDPDVTCILCGSKKPEDKLNETVNDLTTWICKSCSHLNDNYRTKCLKCKSLREGHQNTTNRQDSSKPRSRDLWKCNECFKMNHAKLQHCQICSSSRPPVTASPQKLPPAKQVTVVDDGVRGDSEHLWVYNEDDDENSSESEEEEEPSLFAVHAMRFCLSQYTDKVYVFDKVSLFILRFHCR